MRRTCLDSVFDLAKGDPRVIFIGSDLGAGVLDQMKRDMPERFFMEGIAEQNLIGMSAGLAMEGFVPYVNTIATFITRRCFEQVAIDLCLHNLPVRLIGNGGGLVYAPLGPTHLAIEDVAIMRALPNMTVVAPSDADEMRRFMQASLAWPGPIYIRVAKGGDEVISRDELGFEIGKGICLRDGGPALIVSTGVMTARALKAAERLAEKGIGCTVLHLHTIKPIDRDLLVEKAAKCEFLLTLEEHVAAGGLGSAVVECLVDEAPYPLLAIRRLAIPDTFAENYGSQDQLIDGYGLGVDGVVASVEKHFLDAAAE